MISEGKTSTLPDFSGDVDVALDRGRPLLDWWVAASREGSLKTFPLVEPQEDAQMEGFFDTLNLSGKERTVMGCLQKVRFSFESAEGDSLNSLDGFIHGEFLKSCKWFHPDGLPAGFTYTPLQFKDAGDGRCLFFPREFDVGQLNLSLVGSLYEWVVLRVDIHDFVRSFPPLRRFARQLANVIRESAFVVCDPHFGESGPLPGHSRVLAEKRFGYSFLPRAPEPNPFGFGPGHFWAAVKQFRFLLLEGNRLEIDLAFVVAPRSEKVLNLRGFDPVYGLVHLAHALTLGAFRLKPRLHDVFDRVMLRLHGQVHQNLLVGMSKIWTGRNWVPGSKNPG